MDATVDDLVGTIGEQTVELKLMRKAYRDLQIESNLKDQEITKLKDKYETTNGKKEK